MRITLLATLAAGALLLAACSSSNTGKGGKVGIDLQEWSVKSDTQSQPKGDVIFNVKNQSADLQHEFKVIRTDLAPESLPTKSDGSVDEGAGGIDVVGKISKLDTGDDTSGTFTLKAGKYVLICNIVGDDKNGQQVSHYKQGMHTAFTVTD